MSDVPTTQVDRKGRIITFYSYKGGTGRSMAVANVAWILASQGKKVLVVDWDFEAPGLHRYFHPFLQDKELSSSIGLIDYFFDVVAAARAAAAGDGTTNDEPPWWHEWTSWLRYTYPLDTSVLQSPDGSSAKGSIDFVPAGRQSGDYSERVSSFDWKNFYERLGGGVLLEGVKQRLRQRYDYVLIDSRTGISDTSGVCTVQMPDDLVVCFTLNKQSMFGAAAAAQSAALQRTKLEGQTGLRIWPVPTRIDFAERDRLEAARTTCRQLFWAHLGPLLKTRAERPVYWGSVEILYQPYFAYEEVLAVFAERKHQTSSMLASLESLVARVTDGAVTGLLALDDKVRMDVLKRYVPDREQQIAKEPGNVVYLSYFRESAPTMRLLNKALQRASIRTWVDEQDLVPGSDLRESYEEGLAVSKVLLCLVSQRGLSPNMVAEVNAFLTKAKTVIPVLIDGAGVDRLPSNLTNLYAIELHDLGADPVKPDIAFERLLKGIHTALARTPRPKPLRNPDDPQKGQWGGEPFSSGWQLVASVTSKDDIFFTVTLTLSGATSGTSGNSGSAVFHLHPTFEPPKIEVAIAHGKATIQLVSWGAFTVGVDVNHGEAHLELDLSKDPTFPSSFRAR